ncbi:MAG: aromatic aminobenezylarsenical efflux permease ArsG family transporter [Bacteroidales bacterium]
MELLNSLFENSTFPLFSAFVLGLMTAISPCPLATNITAIGYISKDIEVRRRVFLSGLVYTAGRMLSYTLLAVVLVYSADQFKISGFFQQYGEKFLGPLLVLIGLFMLDFIKIRFPGFSRLSERVSSRGINTYLDALLLGIVFALAFCPYSGVLYFGMLIPMTISNSEGILLPLVYAFATGIPVVIFAWLIAYTLAGVGKLYNSLKLFELWFRRVIALLFIGVGIYYITFLF